MWILPRLTSQPAASQPVHRLEFPFTHHRITLAVYAHESAAPGSSSRTWFPITELSSIPIPSPHRRALNKLLASAS
jgi:adenine-specific DNA glycosylase